MERFFNGFGSSSANSRPVGRGAAESIEESFHSHSISTQSRCGGVEMMGLWVGFLQPLFCRRNEGRLLCAHSSSRRRAEGRERREEDRSSSTGVRGELQRAQNKRTTSSEQQQTLWRTGDGRRSCTLIS